MADRGRVVEVDLANERVVLATMMRDPAALRRLGIEIGSDEFGEQRHKVIGRGLGLMARRGLAYSEDTLAELCKGEDFGGFAYLRTLLKEYEPTRNVDFHVERLRVDAVKLAVLAEDVPALVRECEDPTAPPERIAHLGRAIAARAERNARGLVHSGDGLVDGYYEELRLRRILGGEVEGFGFRILDSTMVRGFSVPGASLIVARPGYGKTTVLANFIRNRARAGKGTFVCGWEMSRTDYLDMMVSAETGIPAAVLSNAVGTLTEEQKLAVQAAVERYRDPEILEIQENPFTRLERPKDRFADVNLRNLDFFEGTLRSVAASGKRVVAIDVIGKMLHDRRPDPVTQVLVYLFELARGLGLHLLVLHHIGRSGAKGRPTLEDIKNSGAFEEEADNVFALDRPMLRASPAHRRRMTDSLDVYLLKQRKGPFPLCVRYHFDGSRFALTDEVEMDVAMLDKEDDEGPDGRGSFV